MHTKKHQNRKWCFEYSYSNTHTDKKEDKRRRPWTDRRTQCIKKLKKSGMALVKKMSKKDASCVEICTVIWDLYTWCIAMSSLRFHSGSKCMTSNRVPSLSKL